MKRIFSFLFRERGVANACPPLINYLDKEELVKFVYEWNNTFPIDRWWREKHGIPFNSNEHRGVSIFDMRFEYEEDVIYNRIRKEEDYKLDSGDFYKKETFYENNPDTEASLQKFLQEEDGFDYSKYDEQ